MKIFFHAPKKHGNELILSYVNGFKRAYPNYAQELVQNYCSGGHFIYLTDAFANWHVLCEEKKTSASNDSNDD